MKVSGFGLPTILFLIFLVLKLCDKIDWSWWWVTSPLWIGWSLVFVIIFVALVIVAAAGPRARRRR